MARVRGAHAFRALLTVSRAPIIVLAALLFAAAGCTLQEEAGSSAATYSASDAADGCVLPSPASCAACLESGGGTACAALCAEAACRSCVEQGGGETCLATCNSGGDGGGEPPDAGALLQGAAAAGFQSFHDLLAEIEGWGTGTDGGIDGTVFVVDTLADQGPGSLRTALTSPEPLWIVFGDGVDGVIEFGSPIYLTSNKTVDARGHDIHIRTPPGQTFTAFKIQSQSNLIFANLRIDDEIDNWDRDSEGADGMTIFNSHHIWIHHCSFARWVDGAIDMRFDPHLPGDLSHHISVTWSHFSRVFQGLNWTATQVSFGHNVCKRIRRRCIQMIEGRGHSYNNVISNWDDEGIQTAKSGAQLYSLRNMWDPDGVNEVDERIDGGKILNSNNYFFGNVSFRGDDDPIKESFKTDSKNLANIVKCGKTDSACWSALRQTTEQCAGVQ